MRDDLVLTGVGALLCHVMFVTLFLSLISSLGLFLRKFKPALKHEMDTPGFTVLWRL